MPKRTVKPAALPIIDYRHAAKRKNNTPAGLAARGKVQEVPNIFQNYKRG